MINVDTELTKFLCYVKQDNRPPNRIDTDTRRDAFRAAMVAAGVDAYLIYNADEHLVRVHVHF